MIVSEVATKAKERMFPPGWKLLSYFCPFFSSFTPLQFLAVISKYHAKMNHWYDYPLDLVFLPYVCMATNKICPPNFRPKSGICNAGFLMVYISYINTRYRMRLIIAWIYFLKLDKGSWKFGFAHQEPTLDIVLLMNYINIS